MGRLQIGLCAMVLLGACGIDPTPQRTENLKNDTRTFRARREIPGLASEIEFFRQREGHWPESWEEMGRRPTDPWGRLYVFEVEDDQVSVRSVGPDGDDGTGDEIYK